MPDGAKALPTVERAGQQGGLSPLDNLNGAAGHPAVARWTVEDDEAATSTHTLNDPTKAAPRDEQATFYELVVQIKVRSARHSQDPTAIK